MTANTDVFRRRDGPGGRLPIIKSTDTVELKETRERIGLFGIGLKVDMDPPHLVQVVSNIKYSNNHSIENRVNVGDSLVCINGERCVGSMESLEKAILGPKNSTLKLGFERMSRNTAEGTNDIYEVEVKRHVPIREWDELHSWIELRQEHKGRPLLAEEDIVLVMEDLRRSVADPSNYALDFIREENASMSSLGMHFQQEMSNENSGLGPNQIHILVPASPAHLSGKLKKGDEIVKVDGVPADAANLPKLLRGTDVIGSKCRVTATTRPGNGTAKTFDIELARTSAFAVRNADYFVHLVDSLDRQMMQRESHEKMMPSLQAILTHFVETERIRVTAESSLADRLFLVQSRIVGLVNKMESMLRPGEPELKDECQRLQAKLKQTENDKDVLQEKMHRMCDRSEFQETQSQVSMLQVSIEGLKIELEGARSQVAMLKEKLQQKRDESNALRAQLSEMVFCKEFLQVKSELHTAQMENISKHKEIAGMREQNLKQAELVEGLKLELEKMHAKTAVMVLRSEQLASQSEAQYAKEEVQVKMNELAAFQDTLSKARSDNQALRNDIESLQSTLRDMVPRSQLLAAKTESETRRNQCEAKDIEIESLMKRISELKEQTNNLRHEKDELQANIATMAPKIQLIAAEEEVRASKSVAEVQAQELHRLEKLSNRLSDELDQCLIDLDDIKSRTAGQVSRMELLNAKAQIRDQMDKMASLIEEVKSLQGNNSDLKKQQAGLKEEIEAWREQVGNMVPRSDLSSAKNEVRAVLATLEDVSAQHAAAMADVRKFQEQIHASKREISVMQEALAEMVPRRDHLMTLSDCQKLIQHKESMERDKAAMEKMLANHLVDISALNKKNEEFQAAILNMAGKDELVAAKAEAQRLSYEVDTLREREGALNVQVESLRARIEIERSEKEFAILERIAFEKEFATFEKEFAILAKVRDELCAFKTKLRTGGLLEVLDNLLEVISEEPEISGLEILELLSAVRSLKVGGIKETTWLVKTIALCNPAMSPADVVPIVAHLEGQVAVPEIKKKAVGVQRSAKSSHKKDGPIEMVLRLNMDFQAVGQEGSIQRQNFIKCLTQDLADASGTGTSDFNILKVSPDSVVVDLNAPKKAAQEIQRQSLDPNSRLRSGKITRLTDKVTLPKEADAWQQFGVALREETADGMPVSNVEGEMWPPVPAGTIAAKAPGDILALLEAMSTKWTTGDVVLLLREFESLDHFRDKQKAERGLELMLQEEKQIRKDLQSLLDQMAPGAPKLEPTGRGKHFRGEVVLTISAECCSETVFCTNDGSKPSPSNYNDSGPSPFTFRLSQDATLQAISRNKIGMLSPIASESYQISPLVMAGVGLLIEQVVQGPTDTQMVVTKVTPGGAADKDGTIAIGDRLLFVDGKSVAGFQRDDLFKVVVGAEGTPVTLRLTRTTSTTPMVGNVSPSSLTILPPPKEKVVHIHTHEYSITLCRCLIKGADSPSVNAVHASAPPLFNKGSPPSPVPRGGSDAVSTSLSGFATNFLSFTENLLLTSPPRATLSPTPSSGDKA